jgi:hypothetical protein
MLAGKLSKLRPFSLLGGMGCAILVRYDLTHNYAKL